MGTKVPNFGSFGEEGNRAVWNCGEQPLGGNKSSELEESALHMNTYRAMNAKFVNESTIEAV